MLHPILLALCMIVQDGLALATDEATEAMGEKHVFFCKPRRIVQAWDDDPPANGRDKIAVISHSLGTRMFFDAMGSINDPKFDEILLWFIQPDAEDHAMTKKQEEIMKDKLDAIHRIVNVIDQRLTHIYALANQVPILEMGEVTSPGHMLGLRARFSDELPGPAGLGRGFNHFLEKRASAAEESEADANPIHIMAFSDPNDLLSYDLKCWYYLSVLRYNTDIIEKITELKRKEKIDKIPLDSKYYFNNCQKYNSEFWKLVSKKVLISTIDVNLASWNIPFIYADAIGAHTRFFESQLISGLIACGSESLDPWQLRLNYKQPATC